MADKHLSKNYFSSERKDMKFLKGFTLVALLPFWAGYAFALYNAICGVEKIENKVLNLVAKLDGVLFFIWVFVTIIQLVIK